MKKKSIAIQSHSIKDIFRSEVFIFAIFLAFSVFLIFLVNIPWSPRFYTMSIDNGIFAFAGKLITQGKLPYLDFWENKPPIIYYINALTFLLSGPTPWAVWWLNVAWLSIVTVVMSIFVRKFAGLIPAIVSGILLIFLVMDGDIFSGGDMTEFFSLLPLILAVWALYGYLNSKQYRWVAVLGVMTALAFLTKQTSITLGLSSFGIVILLSLIKREWWKAILRCIVFGVSLISLNALVLFYWKLRGGLPEYIDQVINFNIVYTQGGVSPSRILLVLDTLFTEQPFMFLMPLVIIAYVLLVLSNYKWVISIFQKKQRSDGPLSPIQAPYLSAFIALPVEIYFLAASVYNFPHYYTLIIPSVVFIITYLVGYCINQIKVQAPKKRPIALGLIVLLFGSIWLVGSIRSEFQEYKNLASIKLPFYGDYPLDDMERYIIDQTEPQDPIEIWDMHTEIYFRTNTTASSRFIHPIPLMSASGKEQSNFEVFMDDLARTPPKLIVAQVNSPHGLPFFDVPDNIVCSYCIPEVQAGLKTLKAFVYANYYIDARFNDWIIYKLKQ
jgi:hypothetical protein